jgi:hypothetical protein
VSFPYILLVCLWFNYTKQSQKVKWIYELLHVKQSVKITNCITPEPNHPAFNTYCTAIHKPADHIREENFRLWLKPRTHRVLNFIGTGKSLSTHGFILWFKHVIIRSSSKVRPMGEGGYIPLQLPIFFNNSCRGIRTRVIVEQTNRL